MQLRRDGVFLAHEEAGAGDPPAVLIHGWASDRSALGAVFDAMQKHRRAVSVDLRGFGESDAPEQTYSIRGFSDDVAYVTSALELSSPIVVGHSMGGIVALDYAARHDVAALIILESPVAPPEAFTAGVQPILEGVSGDGFSKFVHGLMGHMTGAHFPEAERSRLMDIASACPQHVLASSFASLLAYDSVEAAALVKCPVLYVGTKTPYADLGRFRELCPQLVVGQLVGCEHYFPLEVPDQLIPMLQRFLLTEVPA